MAAVTYIKTETQRLENQTRPEKVFKTEAFETLVNRIVRKHITQQYCKPEHPVLVNEAKLIAESAVSLKRHLSATESEWGNFSHSLRKIAIIQHLRALAGECVQAHVETQDLDEDVANKAMETLMEEDFDFIFPKNWMNG
jgi:hypothetical protein